MRMNAATLRAPEQEIQYIGRPSIGSSKNADRALSGRSNDASGKTGSGVFKLTENLIPLIDLSVLAEDEGVRVELEGRPPVAVFLHGGEVHVTDDECTHGPASLSEGLCDEGEIECPFHMGRFCLKTGQATNAPCYEPIAVHRAKVINGFVYLVEP